jgi:hypothetical protein
VSATARDAWEAEGHRVLGTAVAGATAKRLGADAGIRETLTTDALIHRTNNGQLALDERTVVVMDEAAFADTRRLSALRQHDESPPRLSTPKGSRQAAVHLEPMSAVRPWPEVPSEARWVIEAMEEQLEETTATPQELATHARELRARAAAADNEGSRQAALAVAERYEQLAATRLSSA